MLVINATSEYNDEVMQIFHIKFVKSTENARYFQVISKNLIQAHEHSLMAWKNLAIATNIQTKTICGFLQLLFIFSGST